MRFIPTPDEFYIGYLPKAPGKTAKIIARTVVAIAVIVISVCLSLVANQKKFSSGTFEYGQLTSLEGVVSLEPVPNIRVLNGTKTTMIVLVGFGKMGAIHALKDIEQRTGKNINEQFVKLVGTRIYDHGKNLLQIEAEDNLSIEIKPVPENFPAMTIQNLGHEIIEGEIVDPKCYFGVMKPGLGKPHRSCAIRCIAGGIPPVLSAKNGDEEFVILTGEKIDAEILPIVGDPVQLDGEIIQVEDWKIMKVNMDNLKLAARQRAKKQALTLDNDMTLCISNE